MKNKQKELQDRVNDALTAGVREIIVQDTDKQLAIHAVVTAAKAHSETKVQVITSTSRPISKEGKETNGSAMDIIEAHKKTGTGILVAVNILQSYGHSPLAVALLSELASEVKDAPFPRLILVESKSTKIPELLKDDIELINVGLPGVDEQKKEVKSFLEATGRILPGNGEMLEKVAKAVCGVDRNRASRLCSLNIVETGELDPSWLAAAKAEMVMEMSGGMLTIMNPEAPDVGGLGPLVEMAKVKAKAFCSAKAREFGLPEPKGFFLTGVPGCGKTLFAKYVAKEMGLPLVRFDLSKMMSSLVGGSEGNLSSAIDAIEAMSPCVVLMDECDKALAGATGPSGDSGTTQRMFGSLLTWLNERTAPVFIVATSNNAESLPPEVMRKGRFDEVFFIDLPTTKEREDIAKIHIVKRKRDAKVLDPKAIAKATEGFSGSEIEQAILSGLEMAFSKDRELELKDIVEAAEKTNPLSKTQAAKINRLRAWAKERGVVMAGEGQQVPVNVEPLKNENGSLKRTTVVDFNKPKMDEGKGGK
jgi:hypothetical protein